MKHLIAALLSLYLALFTVVSHAATKEEVDTLLLVSGIEQQMNAIPEMMQFQLQQIRQNNPHDVDDDQLAELESAIISAFEPQIFLDELEAQLQSELSSRDVTLLLAWYDSELGQKISAAEGHSSTVEGFQEMMDTAEQLMQQPKSRHELVQTIDELNKATEFATNIQLKVQLGMVMSIASVTDALSHDEIEQLMSDVESQRDTIYARTEQGVLLNFLYAYKNLTDHELRTYAQFMSTPTYQLFTRIAYESMDKIFVEASRNIGRRVVDLYEQEET